MKAVVRAGALVLAFLLRGGEAAAQPVCNGTTEHLMSWPDVSPVWEFCWMRPAQSSALNGSALELRNVYYNGHLVLKRAQVPILNVKYAAGAPCDCYRDWTTSEVQFQADNQIFPGYAEPTSPPITVCDVGGSGGDVGTFVGVAAEKLPDRLILTTQMEAGWYRYTQKWRFYLDGRIEPVFGFAAIFAECVANDHFHHAYFRFDFDIDGPDNDIVTEGPNPIPPSGRRPGPRPPIVTLPTEAMRRNNRPGLTWSVIDSVTRRGYRLVPGEETALPADAFSVGDVWLLRYKANELDDTGQPGSACPIKIGNFVNGETTSSDVVLWYRAGAFHAGGDLDDCHVVGPTLVPIGDWSAP